MIFGGGGGNGEQLDGAANFSPSKKQLIGKLRLFFCTAHTTDCAVVISAVQISGAGVNLHHLGSTSHPARG